MRFYGKSTRYVLLLLILDKVKINVVQLMDQFPFGYQLSACPLVSMIKLLKRRIIQYITSRVETLENTKKNVYKKQVFVNVFFLCVFKSFNTTKPFCLIF